MGLSNSLELQMQQLLIASASADVVQVSAVYDPQLNLGGRWEDSELPPGYIPSSGGVERGQWTASMNRMFSSGTTLGGELDVQRNLFEGIGTSTEPVWRTVAGLSLRQSLWRNAFGASDRYRVAYVSQRLEVLAREYEQRREEIAGRILDTYWRALQARQVVETQNKVLERLRKLLDVNRKYVEDGLLDESAVLAVEASLAVAEVDAVTLEYDAEALDEELKELIVLPSREWDATRMEYSLPSKSGDVPVLPWYEVFEDAIRYRADIDALRREEQRVENLIRYAELENRGDLELTGSIGRGDNETEFSEAWSFDKTQWTVGATYGLALGKSQSRAELMQAMVQRDQVRVQREMLELDVERSCRSAVRQVDTSSRLVPASRRALDAQTRKVELEVTRYQRGQSDTKTLLDYENDRDLAERDHVRARVAHQRALVALELARGLLLAEELP